MPRVSRLKSESGIYHIIIRGINRQTLFFDDGDWPELAGEQYRKLDKMTTTPSPWHASPWHAA